MLNHPVQYDKRKPSFHSRLKSVTLTFRWPSAFPHLAKIDWTSLAIAGLNPDLKLNMTCTRPQRLTRGNAAMQTKDYLGLQANMAVSRTHAHAPPVSINVNLTPHLMCCNISPCSPAHSLNPLYLHTVDSCKITDITNSHWQWTLVIKSTDITNSIQWTLVIKSTDITNSIQWTLVIKSTDITNSIQWTLVIKSYWYNKLSIQWTLVYKEHWYNQTLNTVDSCYKEHWYNKLSLQWTLVIKSTDITNSQYSGLLL